MPDGLVWRQEPHHHWWVTAGEHRWTVQLVPGMIARRSPEWADLAQRQVLVVDEGCWERRGGELQTYLDYFGVERHVVKVPAGEAVKDLDVVHHIARELADANVGPDGPVVAVGGGAVADATRLATALWRRGTVCVCIAMSPLAAVDADVGTKYFVDLMTNHGQLLKNPLGGYRPALVTIADPDLFTTVPEKHVRSATAEILKMMIADREIVWLLEASGLEMQNACWSDPAAVPTLALATHRMLEAIQPNPQDKEKARNVDFGHFVGKVIELLAKPPMPHGWSVAICMAVTIVVAANRNYIGWRYADRLLRLMERLELPIWHELLTADLFERAIEEVKKQRGRRQNIPVPHEDEVVRFVQDMSVPELVEAAVYLESRSRVRSGR